MRQACGMQANLASLLLGFPCPNNIRGVRVISTKVSTILNLKSLLILTYLG
jgi:hypothetical protein